MAPLAEADPVSLAPAEGAIPYCKTLPAWQARFGTAAHDTRVSNGNRTRTASTTGSRLPELLLDASVNGNPQRIGVQAVCHPAGRMMLLTEGWTALRLRPTLLTVMPDGQETFALESISGARYHVDALAQTIDIVVPADALLESRVDAANSVDAAPPPSPRGGYLNYDAIISFGSGKPALAAALEATAFGPFGLAVGSAFVRDDGATGPRTTRGDTYLQVPYPDRMTTLTVGDAVGVGGAWSRPVRFGGIRYARDFGTRPGFVTFPMPSFSGSATLPSTLEVLIDNQRRLTTHVAPGPFDLTNIPINTGAGELQLVVRDVLGREQIITQNYYMSPGLLAPGLSSFSLEAGWRRLNYGTLSNDYGGPVLDGTYRWGLNNRLTTEVRAEGEKDRVALGGGLTALVGAVGVLNAAAGYAAGRGEHGGHYLLGFDASGHKRSGSVGAEFYQRSYRPFAEAINEVRPRRRLYVGAGLLMESAGHLSASYVHQSNWNSTASRFASAGWTRELAGRVGLALSATVDLQNRAWSVNVSISMPLGERISGSVSLVRDGHGHTVYTDAASPSPTGPGTGWRVHAADSSRQQATASASGIYNTPLARFTGDVSSSTGGGTALRVGAAGALGTLGGYGFVTRPIQNSFAIVRTGDVPNASVMSWNQLAAQTDCRGVALVTNLGAYLRNKISVDPAELPMDVEIGATEMEVRAWPRAGVFVDFPIRRTRNALITLRLDNGEPVPAGAHVSRDSSGTVERVAQRGEVWLTDLADVNRLHVQWKGGACSTTVTLGKDFEPGARIAAPACIADRSP